MPTAARRITQLLLRDEDRIEWVGMVRGVAQLVGAWPTVPLLVSRL